MNISSAPTMRIGLSFSGLVLTPIRGSEATVNV
jgi:hypothetical protein